MLRAFVFFLYNADNNVAVQSYNLGMVSCFIAVNWIMEHRSSKGWGKPVFNVINIWTLQAPLGLAINNVSGFAMCILHSRLRLPE